MFNDQWVIFLKDIWASVEGSEREYIGRTFSDKTVDENDEYKYGVNRASEKLIVN